MYRHTNSLDKYEQRNEATVWCKHCQKNISSANYLIHEARCELIKKRMQPPSKELFNQQPNEQIKRPPRTKNRAVSFREQPEQRIQYKQHQEYPEKRALLYKEEYNRGKQISYERRNSFQHVKAPLVENRINQQEKIPCHFCGYMQTLAELDSHPQYCSHQTNQNYYSTKNQPKTPPKYYVAPTKYEAFIQVAKNNLNGNGSNSTKMQQKSNKKLNEQEKNPNIRSNMEKQIPAYLLCPITYNLMTSPMILSSCGHTFEQVKIKEWLLKQRKCPLCSKEASQQMLVKNLALAQACDSYR